MRPETTLQVRPISVPSPQTVGVLGVPLALTDYKEMLDWIDGMVAARNRGYLCACNVHTVMASREDEVLSSDLYALHVLTVRGKWPLTHDGPRMKLGFGAAACANVFGRRHLARFIDRVVFHG